MDVTWKCYFILIVQFIYYVQCGAKVCENYPCANGGVCHPYSDGKGRHCTCQLGFKGSDCLIDVCMSRPCFNGSTCVRTQEGRECVCPIGFRGEDCSIEACTANPCKNGATCIPIVKERQCICPLGFDGDDCSNDLCPPAFCQNGGQCIRSPGWPACICQPGYTGLNCETATCDEKPCLHNRECHLDSDDFQCYCRYEGGRLCEYDNIVPHGQPLLPYSYILPNITKGYIYIIEEAVLTTRAYIYGLRVVTTGKATPFYIQLWREVKNQWRNYTLVYSEQIKLSPKATVQEIKFADHGIKCGLVRDWDQVGLYFPDGSDGIGLHKCHSKCEVYLHRNVPKDLSLDTQLEFEFRDTFQHYFGIKTYFALEGENGRIVDSNLCPENLDLPDKSFGDVTDIVKTNEYSFSFANSFHANEDDCKMNGVNIAGKTMESPEKEKKLIYNSDHTTVIIIGAVLGGLLLISVAVIIFLSVKLFHQRPTKMGNTPPNGCSGQPIIRDGYLVPITNGTNMSNQERHSYLEMQNDGYERVIGD